MRSREIINSIRAQIYDGADISALKEIRRTLDSPAMLMQLLEERRSINDPALLESFDNAILDLWRAVGDKAAELAHDRSMLVAGGISGGAGLIIGGATATAIPVTAPAGLFMILSGGATLGITYIHGLSLARQERLYRDLNDRVAAICEKLQ